MLLIIKAITINRKLTLICVIITSTALSNLRPDIFFQLLLNCVSHLRAKYGRF